VESSPLKDRVVHSRWIVGGLVRTPLAVALLGSWLVALLVSGIAKRKSRCSGTVRVLLILVHRLIQKALNFIRAGGTYACLDFLDDGSRRCVLAVLESTHLQGWLTSCWASATSLGDAGVLSLVTIASHRIALQRHSVLILPSSPSPWCVSSR
jgi:hypothetical protein